MRGCAGSGVRTDRLDGRARAGPASVGHGREHQWRRLGDHRQRRLRHTQHLRERQRRYYYQVQGCNAGGCGPFSAVVAVTVALVPPPPQNLTALTQRAPGKMEAVARWDASPGAMSYQLTATWDGGGGGLVYNGPNLTALVFPQGVNTVVEFVVKACNANGCSANSSGAATEVDNGP
jgi:hypothetical protein